MIWGFDILKSKDANGNVIEPTTEMVRGFLSVPLPFECTIRPRSAKHEQIMRKAFEDAEKEGLKY